jgi:hypothetical protein
MTKETDLQDKKFRETISDVPEVQEAIVSAMLKFWEASERNAETPIELQAVGEAFRGLAKSLQQSYEGISGGPAANARGA